VNNPTENNFFYCVLLAMIHVILQCFEGFGIYCLYDLHSRQRMYHGFGLYFDNLKGEGLSFWKVALLGNSSETDYCAACQTL